MPVKKPRKRIRSISLANAAERIGVEASLVRGRKFENRVLETARLRFNSLMSSNPKKMSKIEGAGVAAQKARFLEEWNKRFEEKGFYPSEGDVEAIFPGAGKIAEHRKKMAELLEKLRPRVFSLFSEQPRDAARGAYAQAVLQAYVYELAADRVPSVGEAVLWAQNRDFREGKAKRWANVSLAKRGA